MSPASTWKLSYMTTPYGYLIDDSATFNPWFLKHSDAAQETADLYRERGKKVTTLWADPAHAAQALEAARHTAATYLMRIDQLQRQLAEFRGTDLTFAGFNLVAGEKLPLIDIPSDATA